MEDDLPAYKSRNIDLFHRISTYDIHPLQEPDARADALTRVTRHLLALPSDPGFKQEIFHDECRP